MPYYRAPNGKLVFSETPLELSQVDPGFARRYVPGHGMQSPSLRQAELLARLPAADIVGFQGPGVVPGGEPSGGARRLQEEIASGGFEPPAPTYRPLGGAQANNRGGSIVVIVPSGGGGSFEDFKGIVETSKNAGDDAEAIGVTLGFQPVVAETTPQVRVVSTALLTWGIGGAIFEAEMDWLQGLTFSLFASYVRVGLRVQSILAASEIKYIFSAALAYGQNGSRGQASPCRLTRSVGSLNALSSAELPIPAWANSFTIVDTNAFATAPTLGISVSTIAGAPIANYAYTSRANGANLTENQYPIPNGGRTLEITNTGGAATSGISVIFNLAL